MPVASVPKHESLLESLAGFAHYFQWRIVLCGLMGKTSTWGRDEAKEIVTEEWPGGYALDGALGPKTNKTVFLGPLRMGLRGMHATWRAEVCYI